MIDNNPFGSWKRLSMIHSARNLEKNPQVNKSTNNVQKKQKSFVARMSNPKKSMKSNRSNNESKTKITSAEQSKGTRKISAPKITSKNM